jgi:maleylpyruvate isomerase
MIRLYGYWKSSCSWRVRIALGWKGVAWESIPVHLVKDGGKQNDDAYVARNPLRQVPWLELADGRGIGQSLAILEWLEEVHPEPPLLPADGYLRAKARQIAEGVNSGIQPLQNLAVLQHVKRTLGADADAWARHWIARGFEGLEAQVAGSAGKFAVADWPSFADVCLVPQLFNARRYGVELAAYPTLLRVEAACMELPAFAAAHPDRQGDKESP